MEYAGIQLRKAKGKYYFEDLALAKTHDNVSYDESKLARFVERHGLSESRSHMFPKWLRLLPAGMRHYDRWRGWLGPEKAYHAMKDMVDHDRLFVQRGNYVYTTQPYDATLTRYQALEAYWRGLGLHVDISMLDAWWYPGWTPLIVIAHAPIPLTPGA